MNDLPQLLISENADQFNNLRVQVQQEFDLTTEYGVEKANQALQLRSQELIENLMINDPRFTKRAGTIGGVVENKFKERIGATYKAEQAEEYLKSIDKAWLKDWDFLSGGARTYNNIKIGRTNKKIGETNDIIKGLQDLKDEITLNYDDNDLVPYLTNVEGNLPNDFIGNQTFDPDRKIKSKNFLTSKDRNRLKIIQGNPRAQNNTARQLLDALTQEIEY